MGSNVDAQSTIHKSALVCMFGLKHGLVSPEKFFCFFAQFWLVPNRMYMYIHMHMHMHMHDVHVHVPYTGPDGINMVEKLSNMSKSAISSN